MTSQEAEQAKEVKKKKNTFLISEKYTERIGTLYIVRKHGSH